MNDRGVPPEPPGVQLKGWESADGRRHGSLLSRGPRAKGGASARAARRRAAQLRGAGPRRAHPPRAQRRGDPGERVGRRERRLEKDHGIKRIQSPDKIPFWSFYELKLLRYPYTHGGNFLISR